MTLPDPRHTPTRLSRESAPALHDREAVERLVRAFHDAWNAHDARGIAAVFADDADFVNVIGLHWRGRAEIEREHVALHATRMRTSRLRTTDLSVRFLRPDVALVHDTWELEGDTGLDGAPQPPRRGVLSFVAVREGSRWLAASSQNTDIVPIPNVPDAE